MLVPTRFRPNHPNLRSIVLRRSASRGPWAPVATSTVLRKDGTEFPVEIGLNPIETEEGTMVLSAIVDISARKRLEERFRQVVESAPNAMVMINRRGVIEMVNAQAERVFGYRARRDAGPADRDAGAGALPRQPSQPARLLLLTIRTSRPMGAGRDLYGLKKDGSEFPVEIGLNPIETDEGTMVLSAIVDISARKRLEERFRQVVESAPNAMVMINGAACIEMVNAQAERVFGYRRAELLGQSIEMLVPERFRGNHPDLRGAFFADPRSRPMGAGRDLYGLRKDGSEFPVEIGLNPIETDEGTMVLSAIVDISARKRLEERFRQVVESAPNAMVMINEAGVIEMVNAQAERVFGYSPRRAAGPAGRDAGAGALPRPPSGPARLVLRRSAIAADGRRARPLRPDEGRQRVPGRDRPQPDRDRRGHHGALGHRRHLGPQAQGGEHPRRRSRRRTCCWARSTTG